MMSILTCSGYDMASFLEHIVDPTEHKALLQELFIYC